MGDTLGNLDTLDKIQSITGITKYSKSEVLESHQATKALIDLLPDDALNGEYTYIDIATKSGRFLTSLYEKLFHCKDLQALPEDKRRHHILTNQLYGLATSNIAATIVRKQLYNDAKRVGNILYSTNPLDINWMQGAFNRMKFDVVIGNPPYNRGGGT